MAGKSPFCTDTVSLASHLWWLTWGYLNSVTDEHPKSSSHRSHLLRIMSTVLTSNTSASCWVYSDVNPLAGLCWGGFSTVSERSLRYTAVCSEFANIKRVIQWGHLMSEIPKRAKLQFRQFLHGLRWKLLPLQIYVVSLYFNKDNWKNHEQWTLPVLHFSVVCSVSSLLIFW